MGTGIRTSRILDAGVTLFFGDGVGGLEYAQ